MLTARTNVWIYYISGGDERQEKREQMYGGNIFWQGNMFKALSVKLSALRGRSLYPGWSLRGL